MATVLQIQRERAAFFRSLMRQFRDVERLAKQRVDAIQRILNRVETSRQQGKPYLPDREDQLAAVGSLMSLAQKIEQVMQSIDRSDDVFEGGL